VICASPDVVRNPVGAPGTLVKVTAVEVAEYALVPALFTAATRNT
jgi:hypothetical protein